MTSFRIRLCLPAVVIIVAVMACLEGGAWLLERYVLTPPSMRPTDPGWQTRFFGSLFDWHEPDPYLLWRFKAHLDNPLIATNSRHVLGPEISPDKAPFACRILILGDSSPVGLGLSSRQQTFGERLRYLLEKYWAARKRVEVVNASVSGYSSEQVARYLDRYGWDYNPDYVVIYCGNNDASVSGTFTDRELLSRQKLAGPRTLFAHSALYRVMRAFLQSPGDFAEDSSDRPLTVRVTPDQFGENLSAIAGECRRRQVPLIVLSPPIPYLWPAGLQFKPFLHLDDEQGHILLPPGMSQVLGRDIAYCLDRDRFRKLYGGGDIFTKEVYRSAYTDTGNSDLAIREYRARLARDSLDPAAWNNLGVLYWKRGEYATADGMFHMAREAFGRRYPDINSPLTTASLSPILFNRGINLLSQNLSSDNFGYDTTGRAFIYLDSAVQCDYFSLRIKKPYRDCIDRLIGTPWVSVIDLPLLFAENGGERLFIDHCHPTPEGHWLIARALFDTILDRQ